MQVLRNNWLRSAGRIRRTPLMRRGFTLIEMLVVVGIMLLLTTLVVMLWNSNAESERVRGGARQLQSSFLALRDRAFHAKAPRGFRLRVDPADPTVVTGMVYIAPTEDWREGSVQLVRSDLDNADKSGDGSLDSNTVNPDAYGVPSNSARYVVGYGTEWKRLYDRQLLVDGARIRLSSTGSWYTVTVNSDLINDTSEKLILNTPYRIPEPTTGSYALPSVVAYAPSDYILELAPSPLPDEKPIQLPAGMVIDLDNCQVPAGWRFERQVAQTSDTVGSLYSNDRNWMVVFKPSSGMMTIRRYSPRMDVMFSSRGTVMGPLAAQGLLHMILADTRDSDLSLHPAQYKRDSLLVSLFTRTGNVSVFPLYTLGPDGQPGLAGVDDDNLNGIDDIGEIGWVDPGGDVSKHSDEVLSANLLTLFRFAQTGGLAGK